MDEKQDNETNCGGAVNITVSSFAEFLVAMTNGFSPEVVATKYPLGFMTDSCREFATLPEAVRQAKADAARRDSIPSIPGRPSDKDLGWPNDWWVDLVEYGADGPQTVLHAVAQSPEHSRPRIADWDGDDE